jgi:hypothetical protein
LPRMSRSLLFLAILVIGLTGLGGVGVAQADGGGESEGGLHCTLGAIAFALVLGVLTTGALTSGRFGRIKGFKPYSVHMIGPIIMSAYMTGLYIYGTLIAEHFSFPGNTHGQLGLLTVIFSWSTVGSSPCVLKKALKKEVLPMVHRVMAILLVISVAVQVIYGYLFVGD